MMKRMTGYILSIIMALVVIGCCHMDFYEEIIISVTGVKLDKEALELVEGDSYQLTATVTPANAHNKKVAWNSSNESIAIVDQHGKVTAVKEGVAIIIVTTEDGGKTATCEVTVKKKEEPAPEPIPVIGVTLDKSELELTEGDTAELVATVTPDDADNKNVIWSSSDESIATVDQDGKVTAVKEGVAVITVTTEDGGKTATCEVTVRKKEEPAPDPIPVIGVTLDKTELTLIEGETAELVATVTPDDADNKNVIWSSSDESIVTVDQDGKVTAVKEGVAVITVTAEDGDKTATCEVTIKKKEEPAPEPIPVVGVSLDKTELELIEGETAELVAIVTPKDADNKNVTWSSSDESIATVDQNGKVTAVKEGVAIITVTTEDGDKTATCKVTVKKKVISVTDVILDETELELTEGESSELVAIVIPGNADNKNVTWSSSDESIATVDQHGKVTALKEGVAIITVTTEDGGKSATCEVTVLKKVVFVTDVTLNETEIEMAEDEVADLVATVSPADADNKKVNWSSSDESIATVDQNGRIYALKEGYVTITVTTEDGGKTATCEVTVTKRVISVISVSLNKTELKLKEGATETLIATVTPDNADDKTVTWNSDHPEVATVDANGKVTAVRAGSCTITVKTNDGGKTATCEVIVIGDVTGGTEEENTGGEGNGNINWD